MELQLAMADKDHLQLLGRGRSVWNKWRSENPEIVPDLSGWKPRIMFPFEEAAHLGGYNLGGVDLSGADLRGIFFYSEDLEQTSLHGAILSGAHLERAVFAYVDLRDADFSDALLSYTIFSDTDFSRTKGLEKVKHASASFIDVATLEATFRILRMAGESPYHLKSFGIPEGQRAAVELFFGRSGMPEHLLRHYQSLSETDNYFSCFISYSHSDLEFARKLEKALWDCGVRCWRDEHKLLPGDDMLDEIHHGIKRWDKVLLCCSETSLSSWWVEREIDKALQKEESLSREKKRKILALIPLDLDGHLFSAWDGSRASVLRSRYAADFRLWRDADAFDQQMKSLIRALNVDRLRRGADPLPKL